MRKRRYARCCYFRASKLKPRFHRRAFLCVLCECEREFNVPFATRSLENRASRAAAFNTQLRGSKIESDLMIESNARARNGRENFAVHNTRLFLEVDVSLRRRIALHFTVLRLLKLDISYFSSHR